MATKINNFERTLRDRNKCEKILEKDQLVQDIQHLELSLCLFSNKMAENSKIKA